MTAPDDARRVAPRFATVVLDVDSTLSGVEGIDWLAARRDAGTAAWVRRLTNEAMNGRITLEKAYARRLERIAPARDEVRALAAQYRAALAPGAGAAIAELQRAGVRVIAVSGGLREAIIPLCVDVSIPEHDVFAVGIEWDAHGAYRGFEHTSPLTTQRGKAAVLRTLALPRPMLAVGDGSTDVAMKDSGAADQFAAFVAFVRREGVVAAADHVLQSFDELLSLVLSHGA